MIMRLQIYKFFMESADVWYLRTRHFFFRKTNERVQRASEFDENKLI